MPYKKIVIHPNLIEWELSDENLHPDDREEAETALRKCNEAIANATNLVITDDLPAAKGRYARLENPNYNGDVYLLRDDNPLILRDCLQPGDDVEILGAYRDICVKLASVSAEEAGAKATISERGTYQGKERE